MSHQTFREFFSAWNDKFQSWCWDFGKKLPHMVGKNWRLHQNWTLPARGTSWGNVFIKWHDLDLLSLLAEDLRHGFQKWFIRVLGNVLRRNIVFEGITFVISVWIVGVQSGVLLWVFLSLRVNEPKTYGFSAKRFRQLHQNCILRLAVKKNCFFFSKKHNVIFCFGFPARKFLVMDEKFMVALLDLLSKCLANMSRILDNMNIFSQLSGFEQKEVGLLVKNFPQDCRIYIIRVQKITLTGNILFGRIFF